MKKELTESVVCLPLSLYTRFSLISLASAIIWLSMVAGWAVLMMNGWTNNSVAVARSSGFLTRHLEEFHLIRFMSLKIFEFNYIDI